MQRVPLLKEQRENLFHVSPITKLKLPYPPLEGHYDFSIARTGILILSLPN